METSAVWTRLWIQPSWGNIRSISAATAPSCPAASEVWNILFSIFTTWIPPGERDGISQNGAHRTDLGTSVDFLLLNHRCFVKAACFPVYAAYCFTRLDHILVFRCAGQTPEFTTEKLSVHEMCLQERAWQSPCAARRGRRRHCWRLCWTITTPRRPCWPEPSTETPWAATHTQTPWRCPSTRPISASGSTPSVNKATWRTAGASESLTSCFSPRRHQPVHRGPGGGAGGGPPLPLRPPLCSGPDRGLPAEHRRACDGCHQPAVQLQRSSKRKVSVAAAFTFSSHLHEELQGWTSVYLKLLLSEASSHLQPHTACFLPYGERSHGLVFRFKCVDLV